MIQTIYACYVNKETKHYTIYWYALINGNMYGDGKTFTDLSMIDENVESVTQEMHHTCEHISFANKHGSFVFIDQYLKRSSNRYVQRAPGDIDDLEKYVIRQYPGFKLFNHSEELKRYVVCAFAWEDFSAVSARLFVGQKQPPAKDQPVLFYCRLPRDRFGRILTIGWQVVWKNNLYTNNIDLNLSNICVGDDLRYQLRTTLKNMQRDLLNTFAATASVPEGEFNADLRANIPIDESIIYANSISELLANMLTHEGTPGAVKGALSLQNSMRFCTVEVIA